MQQLLPLFDTGDSSQPRATERPPLIAAGLFAGIGGIEVGLHEAGHTTALLCELDKAAQAVLKVRFPGTLIHEDIKTLEVLPEVDLLTAGFPCQDLSIAGQRVGIEGERSSLVSHVFRLLDNANSDIQWLLLENVTFMLQLQNGKGMSFLIAELERRKLRWAYRVIDTRAFGIPHRRNRVLLLASRDEDPRQVLLSQDAGAASPATSKGESSYGFYWTEGNRGIGWTEDGVPPIKIGSGLGIPSSPAIWDPGNHTIHKLDIRDVERLQGFDVDWTSPAEEITKAAARWKLVGNSVSVPLGAWVGECLIRPIDYDSKTDWPLIGETKWPSAAWGEAGKRFAANVSAYPVAKPLPRLRDFLLFQGEALSSRAAAGLLKRITNGTTRTSSEFLSDIKALAKAEVQRKYEQRLATLKNEIAAKTKELEQETVFGRKMTLAEEIKALKTTLAEEERSWDLESE